MTLRAALGGWIVALVVLCGTPNAHAQAPTVAVVILPLDADKALTLYGQPVANELGRALKGGDVDVVLVGPRMSVPVATLVIDGTVKQGGADQPKAVVLSLRVRNPADGSILEQLSSTAASLSTIDQAAADLAERMLPLVRAQLERLATVDHPAPRDPVAPPAGSPVIAPVGSPDPHMPPIPAEPIAIAISAVAGSSFELRAALAPAVDAWTRAGGREPRSIAPDALKGDATEVRLAFVVLEYAVTHDHGVPLARARVRVTISGRGLRTPFDRVIATDTIVGGKPEAPAQLAARTAMEVLAILLPHVRRNVQVWQ